MTAGETQPGDGAGAAAGRPRSPFVPMLLLATTVLGATAFQTLVLFTSRGAFVKAITAQDPQMEQSKKVRTALESIATRTARVAQAGNANATVIVEELRKRGITINPDSPVPAP
jgi:hypothetical protein